MDVTMLSYSLVLPYTDYALLTGSNFCPLGYYHFMLYTLMHVL